MKIHDIQASNKTPKEKLKQAAILWEEIEIFFEGMPVEEQLKYEKMVTETLSITVDLYNLATLGHNPYKNYEDLKC